MEYQITKKNYKMRIYFVQLRIFRVEHQIEVDIYISFFDISDFTKWYALSDRCIDRRRQFKERKIS